MKKSLVALAALAVVGAASAQSTVTLFGIVDASYAHTSGGGVSRDGMTNSGLNSSRLGFKGTEDLGGGLKAGFWLEGDLMNDVGAGRSAGGGLDFARRSYVSLTGGFGEVRLGREYSPTFWNTTIYDPFGTNGIGSSNAPGMIGNVNAVRSNNSVSYLMSAGGVSVHAMYAFGEQPSNIDSNVGDYAGIRVAYAAGPLDIAAAFGNAKGAIGADDVRTVNFGVSYDLGMAKPMLQIGQDKNDSKKVGNVLLGVTVPLGQGELRAAYSRYDTKATGFDTVDWSKLAVGYGYNLSKRTQVYGTLAKVSNKAGAAKVVDNRGLAGNAIAGGSSSGYEFGVRHSF